ncbi:MAG: hypothetical protein H6706_00775 [Myxococcales bacterium]|nr:hypothetical protein [Myxococcales bacterium]
MRIWISLIGLLCLPAAAVAEQAFVEFERLDTVRAADQVEVRYKVTSASWQILARAGLRPTLVAEMLAPGRKSQVTRGQIDQQTGRFTVTLREGLEPESVRFAVQHPAIAGFRQAGVTVVTLSRRIGAGQVAAPAGVSGRSVHTACASWRGDEEACRHIVDASGNLGAAVIVACGEQGRNRTDCLRAASRGQGDMAGTVRACSSLVANIDERQRCLAAASQSRGDPVGLVRACGRLVETGAARLTCVERGALAQGDGGGLVEQCAVAFEGALDRLDCLAIGANSARILAPSIAACQQAIPWSGPRRRCVEAAAAARVDLSSAIIACRSGASSPAAVLECVQVAARGRGATIATTIHGCSRGAADDHDFNACVAQSVPNN